MTDRVKKLLDDTWQLRFRCGSLQGQLGQGGMMSHSMYIRIEMDIETRIAINRELAEVRNEMNEILKIDGESPVTIVREALSDSWFHDTHDPDKMQLDMSYEFYMRLSLYCDARTPDDKHYLTHIFGCYVGRIYSDVGFNFVSVVKKEQTHRQKAAKMTPAQVQRWLGKVI